METRASYIIIPLLKIITYANKGIAEACNVGLLRCCFLNSENWTASRYTITLSLKTEMDENTETSSGA